MSQNYAYSERVCRFAVVDMDGDSVPEVLLELDDYVGYIILRYVDGQIHGNVLGYRSMSSIRENGTFESEGSAFEGWLQKLYFIGDTVVMDWKVYSLLSAYSELYCIDDISVGKEDYQRANALYEGCPEVEWHDYTEEDALYYEYGDKAFRRVLRLINVYYGYEFYDWTD